jgi:TPR repeat protein
LKAGSEVDAKRLGDVVYATDPGQKSVELIPYTVRSGGQSASGAVAIVFDPSVAPQEEQPLVIASNEDQISTVKAVPVKLTLKPDVGTGFAPVPKLEIGGGRPTGWLRLEARDPSTQVALGEKLLVLGDLVKAEDLSSVKVRPALHQTTKQAEIVLQPAVATPDAKAVVIAVDAEVNACDELAAEPLDIQAVTDGVLPNDIKVAEALQACSEAVTDFPDVPRFKFQYGRVLWADGKFDLSVKMVREAVDGGHVRAGQFLGRLYQLGSGVEVDPKKAIPLFEAAAEKGDPYGQYSLARALMDGKGVKKDLKRGIDLLNKSMESGHTYAMNQLGSEYLYGGRVEKDVDRARVIFEMSVGRGDVWGEVNLATMYRDGIGVPKDTEKAYQLLSDANAKLHPFAARLMALMDRDAGKSDPAALLAKYRESAARGDGWGAYFAAEVITENPSLANSPDEAVRLYAFAVARNAGDSAKDARARLQNIPGKQVAEAAQQLLVELGATDVAVDGKIGPGARKAASEILGTKAPSNAIDLYAELVRYQWVSSRPRLDML